jgi:hypothetical protein
MGCITLPPVPKEVSRVPLELKRAMQKSLLLPLEQKPPSKIFPSGWIAREYPLSSVMNLWAVLLYIARTKRSIQSTIIELKRVMQKSPLPSILQRTTE